MGAAIWARSIVVVGLALGARQARAPEITIVAPEEGAYVSGTIALRASVDPPKGVSAVEFYADGTLTCTVDRAPFECLWDAGPNVREHHIRAVARLADGSRVVRNVRTRTARFDDSADVEAVLVTAVVSDGDRFVKGLAENQFRVFEDERVQKLTHFAAENIPLELVVAVDISSSMRPVLPQVKLAVTDFLATMRPEDRVTLVAFNDNIFTLARKETEQARRQRALDRLNAWGGTALYDVIVKSLGMLERQQGRRAIVLFTDGNDRSSRTTLEQVQRAVESSDASLYMIVQARSAEVVQSKQIVQQLTDISGGHAFFSNKVEQLKDDFHKITDELSNQYLLAYVSSDPNRDDRWRKIRVELTGGRYKVRARRGYRATARAVSP